MTTSTDSTLSPGKTVSLAALVWHAGLIWRDPPEALRLVQQQYGDLVRLPVRPFADVFVLSHPAFIRRILIENRQNYRKSHLYQLFQLGFGEGLVFSEGALWQQQRRLIQPAFAPGHVAGLGELAVRAAAARIPAWEQAADAQAVIDVQDEMLRVVRAVIARSLFGALTPEGLDAEIEAVRRAFMGAARASLVLGALTPAGRRLQRTYRRLHARVWQLMGLCRARLAADGRFADGGLVAQLMTARDPRSGARMTDAQLHDELVTLIFTGYETTAQMLTWTWWLLAQHPDVWAALADEWQRVLGGRAPSVAHLPELDLTQRVLSESLRLYPPAWSNGRQAIGPDEIGGVAIPAGAYLVYSQYAIHRHPDFWPEPDRFDPDRWLPAAVANRHEQAFLAFGAGARQCIGRDFALMEGALILATLGPRFRLQPKPRFKLKRTAAVTLQPRGGLQLRVSRAG